MSALLHPIPELDSGGLRRFALSTAAIVAVLFGLLLPWLFDFRIPLWPWPLAAVLAIWGLIAPRSLRPVYRHWMQLGLLISRVTTPIVLGLVFILLFLPVGLMMRLAGHDPMKRRFEPNSPSYREPSRPATPESMKNPF